MEDAIIKQEEKRLKAESELQIRREEQYRQEKEDRKQANIDQTLKTWDDTTEAKLTWKSSKLSCGKQIF